MAIQFEVPEEYLNCLERPRWGNGELQIVGVGHPRDRPQVAWTGAMDRRIVGENHAHGEHSHYRFWEESDVSENRNAGLG